MKIKSLLTALTSWVIISLPIVEASDSLLLTGRALYSFSTEYALIATESHIYKILKSNISEEDLAQINHSSIQNNTISINVPKSSIEFLWPYRPQLGEEAAEKFNASSSALLIEAKANDGEVALNGKTTLSFSEPFFLVQSENQVFRIAKSKLSKNQYNSIANTGLGNRLSIAIPKESVQLAWSIQEPNTQNQKSLHQEEIYSIEKKTINVTGIVLLSFDEPLVLIQSKDMIFQFNRENIQADIPSHLNIPGAMVKIRAPLSALKFVWPSGADEINPMINNKIQMN